MSAGFAGIPSRSGLISSGFGRSVGAWPAGPVICMTAASTPPVQPVYWRCSELKKMSAPGICFLRWQSRVTLRFQELKLSGPFNAPLCSARRCGCEELALGKGARRHRGREPEHGFTGTGGKGRTVLRGGTRSSPGRGAAMALNLDTVVSVLSPSEQGCSLRRLDQGPRGGGEAPELPSSSEETAQPQHQRPGAL